MPNVRSLVLSESDDAIGLSLPPVKSQWWLFNGIESLARKIRIVNVLGRADAHLGILRMSNDDIGGWVALVTGGGVGEDGR